MLRPITFEIEKRGPSLSRAGVIKTPHGDIKTPTYVPVATKATLKGVLPSQFPALGIQTMIANTYHLYLSPGEELVRKAGGIHTFMDFQGPLMTDSGGFQVFSLGVGFGKKVSKFVPEEAPREAGVTRFDQDVATSHGKLAIVDDEGVTFTSHIDGTLHRFTPERSIEIQQALGADIIFAFDECTAPEADYEYQKEAADRTHRWARRSLASHRSMQIDSLRRGAGESKQGIYGIVQGGRFEDLRIESARVLADMDFDGYGIGGSFSKEDILGVLEKVDQELPEEKPRHLLGIGEPEDIFIGVAAGIDTFDCVLPTRNGRNGTIYTKSGKIHIGKAEFREDFNVLDEGCDCPVCQGTTRAYIHHLFRAEEMLGPILATMHNVRFMTRLVENVRDSILSGNFEEFRDSFLEQYKK
jgi:queuine tRNA-ribosyltransferase